MGGAPPAGCSISLPRAEGSTRPRDRSAWNIANANWGADLNRSVALAGSVMTKPFICDRMSRSCGGGRLPRVREMASGAETFGGGSVPGGRGGSELGCGTDAAAGSDCPFDGPEAL
jgi:hypothetical protein